MANIPEEALLALAVKNKGGGGGTTNYNELDNQPQIGGVTLTGNKSASDLGLADDNTVQGILDGQSLDSFSDVETALAGKVDKVNGKGLSTNDYDDTEKGKNADNATAIAGMLDGTDIDSFGDVETALAGKQGTILHGALDASGGVDGDLYLKTASSSNMDVCGTPTANTGNGYEISTNVSVYSNYEAYKAFGDGDGFGKNGMGDATLVYHVTSGKKFKPSVISLCNNFDVSGGFLTAKGYAYASTDGVNWDTLFSFFDLSTKNESISFDITTNKFYSYFKFQFGGSGGYPGIKNIVILGESDSEDDNRVDNVFYKQDGKWLKDAFAKKADVDSALAEKQDTLTFDNAPTENSNNPVKSGGIFTALAGKVNAENGKGLSTNDYSDTEKTQVATNASDIGQLKSGLTTLDTEVNGDATVYQYADVITIEDAVPSNLADCSVKIEPVQDLHGYDKPWVGGAGKNKLPLVLADIKALNTDGTWSGNAYTLNDVTFTVNEDNDGNVTGIKVNGTATANTYFYIDSPLSLDDGTAYYFNGCPTGGSSSTFRLQVYVNSNYYSDSGNGNNFTYVSGSSYARISVISGTELSNIDFYPMICLNSETDKTYAPYSNICPISGYTEASVQRDGVNQWEFAESYSGTGGLATNLRFSNSLKPNTYTISCKGTFGNGGAIQFTFMCEDGSKPFITLGYDKVGDTYYSSGTITKKIVGIHNIYSNNAGNSINDVQLELGSTATPYEPYQGKTYTIALGDTIYKGLLDVDTGVFTSYNVKRLLNDPDKWISTSGNIVYKYNEEFTDRKQYTSDSYAGVFTSFIVIDQTSQYTGRWQASDSNYFGVRDDNSLITLEQLKTRASAGDLSICYELATPTTIQLTPQQIQLLKGQNTLTASTGEISVTVNGVSGAIGAVQEQVNELANAVGVVKELRYTGTGTAQNTIDFGNDTPTKIMCIIPDPDEEFLLSNYEAIGEISWGMMLAFSYWSTQSGGVPTTSNGGTNLIRMSFSGNTVTLNAGNAAQIANYSGQKYLLKYEV